MAYRLGTRHAYASRMFRSQRSIKPASHVVPSGLTGRRHLSRTLNIPVLVAVFTALGTLGYPDELYAQTRATQVGVSVLAGIERGAGQAGSAVLASPLQLELSARTWSDEFKTVAIGGALRVEVNGAGGIAAVPRLEFRHLIAGSEIRPGLAFPIYFAPMTLFGPEASLGFRTAISDTLGLIASISMTAFVAGKNLPDSTTLLQFNGGIGIDLQM